MDNHSLLQNIRKHLNIKKLLKAEPGLSEEDIETFFRKIQDALGIQPPVNLLNISGLKLYIDGAARGNPGPAAVGCVLMDTDGNSLLETGKIIGTATNNVAEYQALLYGLELAMQFSPESLAVYSDSELLVRQMTGVYKTKDKKLKDLKEQASVKLRQFKNYSFSVISRSQNTSADALANQAFNEQ